MTVEDLERLDVWRKAIGFAQIVYQDALPLLPKEEQYGLGQQIRRAVSSIPANIAEGVGRYSYAEMIRFCYIARGSLMETISHLALAEKLGYLPNTVLARANDEAKSLRQVLSGYLNYLRREQIASQGSSGHSAREAGPLYETGGSLDSAVLDCEPADE